MLYNVTMLLMLKSNKAIVEMASWSFGVFKSHNKKFNY